MRNIVILFFLGVCVLVAKAQDKPPQITVKKRPAAVWFNERLADSLKNKRTLHLEDIFPIQAIISDRQHLYIRLRGQEVNTILDYYQGEQASVLNLKFEPGFPGAMYKEDFSQISFLLKMDPDELVLKIVDKDGMQDSVSFRLLNEPLLGKDIREVSSIYRVSGKYRYIDSLNKERLVSLDVGGDVIGLDNFKKWAVSDKGIAKPDNIWSSAKTTLTLRGKATKSYYIELEPHTKIWYLYNFEVDKKNIIHLKERPIGKLIPVVN